MPPPTSQTPEQILWDLICRLYRLYGGDCANLPKLPDHPPVELVQFIWDQYTNNGAPPVANADVLQELLDLLTELENFLNSSQNPLNATLTQSLLNLIAAIRDDVT